MRFKQTTTLDDVDLRTVFRLWNAEYPAVLGHGSEAAFRAYLEQLENADHHLVTHGGAVCGWAVAFDREEERWFILIVDGAFHGCGLGSRLLDRLKTRNLVLNGWVVEQDSYLKSNGQRYHSPQPFYEKQGFATTEERRTDGPVAVRRILFSSERG